MSYRTFTHSIPIVFKRSTHITFKPSAYIAVFNVGVLIRTLLIAFGISANAAATDNDTQIWKEEKNGVTIYTDTPSDSRQPVLLSPNTTFSTTTTTTPIKNPSNTTNSVSQASNEPRQATANLTLISPINEQAIRANNGTIQVRFSLNPILSDGHTLQWVIDDKSPQNVAFAKKASDQPFQEFNLINLDRGQHSIQLQLLDNSGKIIAKTPLTVFYVLRHHINAPN